MNRSREVELDRSRVEADVEKAREALAFPKIWFLKRWLRTFVLFLLVLALADLPGRIWATALPWSGGWLFLRVGIASIVAASLTWMEWKIVPRSDVILTRRISKEWRQLTSAGWIRRLLLLSLAMAFVIGVPVGLLLVWAIPVHELPFESRFAGVLAFVGSSLLWIVPFAFGIRYLGIRQLRRRVVTER